jgi:hypothetical protein
VAKRKFSALADFRQLATDDEAEPPPAEMSPPQERPADPPRVASEPVRAKGRPPGKRSNPEWKLYSHFLKKQTQRRAAAHLAALEDGRDLSDVLQELLERWLKDQET